MTALNKQALREAAVALDGDDWHAEGNSVYGGRYDVGDNVCYDHIASCESVNGESHHAEFIAAANPATVLALLDELEAAEKRVAELESAFPDGWQFEECESEGCENGAIFNVGTGINNIHVCEKCASEERYFRLKKSALPKRLPFKFATGIGVKGE
ncbi:ead/Ea22-like family protein [Escherichia coli]|nr:ead/Ea22-like family protein [Escherichia coli]ELL8690809.1 ead/Ea22-like family protein [Escherichia coli]